MRDSRIDGRIEIVRQHGHDPISYSTLQPTMQYFDTSFGYIAYKRVWGMDITLGPPVCHTRDYREMIARFLSFSPRPIFCYVQQDFFESLGTSKLHCAGMGIDRYVNYAKLFSEPSKEVKGALKKADKSGFQLEAVNFQNLTQPMRKRLDEISTNFFRKARCAREMTFINRPMSFHDDGLRRTFLLTRQSHEHTDPFGYAVLNPVFNSGHIDGYLLDILRFEPTRQWGVWFSTVWHLARLLHKENKFLSLGYCPLHKLVPAPRQSSPWLEMQLGWMARYLASTQYIRRLHEMKSLIPGHDEPRFFASFSNSALVNFLALTHASGLTFSGMFSADLLRSVVAGLRPGKLEETSS